MKHFVRMPEDDGGFDAAAGMSPEYPVEIAVERSAAGTACVQNCCDGLTGTLPEHPGVISYLFSWRHDNRMIHVSKGIDSLGFPRQFWLKYPDFRLKQVHEDDFERFYLAQQHSIRSAERFNCQYRLYDSRRNIRWYHDEACISFDAAGEPDFLAGIMLDITDKKHMEIELNEHRYYFERKVAQRTERFKMQLALLESCNAALCRKLDLARFAPHMPDRTAGTLDPEASLDEPGELRCAFDCRATEAGAIG